MKPRWSASVALSLPVLVACLAIPGLAVASEALKVDSTLQTYKAVSGVSGNLSSVGSDTMNNLMTLWSEGFGKFYPNVKLQIEGKGSSDRKSVV